MAEAIATLSLLGLVCALEAQFTNGGGWWMMRQGRIRKRGPWSGCGCVLLLIIAGALVVLVLSNM